MSRLPKPRSQSANTTRPSATARTSSPARAGDEQPLPDHAAVSTWTAEAVRKFPADRQIEPSLHLQEGAVPAGSLRDALVFHPRGGLGARHQPAQALDQPRETVFVALQRADLAPLALDVARDPGEHLAARALVALETAALRLAARAVTAASSAALLLRFLRQLAAAAPGSRAAPRSARRGRARCSRSNAGGVRSRWDPRG